MRRKYQKPTQSSRSPIEKTAYWYPLFGQNQFHAESKKSLSWLVHRIPACKILGRKNQGRKISVSHTQSHKNQDHKILVHKSSAYKTMGHKILVHKSSAYNTMGHKIPVYNILSYKIRFNIFPDHKKQFTKLWVKNFILQNFDSQNLGMQNY
jgi:hypothetical protein